MKYPKVSIFDTNHKVTEEKIRAKLVEYILDGRCASLGYDKAREMIIEELNRE